MTKPATQQTDPTWLFDETRDNPLVAAANPLLNTLPKLRHTTTHPDPAALRQHLIEEIRRFEVACQQAEQPYEVIIGARYCLCTALDEAAALTPWGSRSVWSGSGLLVTFHNETWGGEKFFQLLAKLSQSPKEHLWLLELLNFCLLLGFEGRYRVMDNGRSQLETLKQRLYQLIHSIRGHHSATLSPNLQLLNRPNPRWKPFLPLWISILLLGFLGCLLYIGLNWRLENITTPVLSTIYQIPLPEVPERKIASPPPIPSKEKLLNLKSRLQPEIDAGLLTVTMNDKDVITLEGNWVFRLGSARINKNDLYIIKRIAEEINHDPNDILVVGYTDNVPIYASSFKSNYALSLARAKSVQKELQRYLDQPERVKIVGKGASDPLVPNDSPANRAKNRRVGITLLVSPEAQIIK